jgi:iron complex outermembrane receptor protein
MVGAAICGLSPTAHAQSDDSRPQLEEVVVTARRVTERLQDVPVAVTALSGAELRRQSVREFKDVGQTVPNVRFEQSNASADSVNIQVRGQSQADVLLTTDSSVGLYLDGVSVPRLYGLRGAFVDMERVEVLRGPQGTLYGRNTTGGAVTLFSRDPRSEFGASIDASYGNFDARSIVAVVNAPLADGMAARLVGAISKRDGYGRDQAGRQLASEDSKYVRGKVRMESGAFTATLAADYTDYSDGGPIGHLTALTAAAPALGLPPGGAATLEIALRLRGALTPQSIGEALTLLNQYLTEPNGKFHDSWGGQQALTRYTGWRGSLNAEWRMSDQITLRSITGYSEFQRRSLYEPDQTPYPLGTTDASVRENFFSQELQLLGNMERLKWVLGGYYSREHGFDLTLNDYLPVLTGGLRGVQDGEVTNRSVAGFAQATLALSDTVNITGGVRYTQERKSLITQNRSIVAGVIACQVPVSVRQPGRCLGDISDRFSKASWLASADWKPQESVLLYAKVSRGFRGGGQNLRGTSEASFQPFAPEIATEYELGAKTEFLDRRLRLNLALWQDDYKNIQRSIVLLNPTSGTADTLITNATAATLKGFEAEAILRPIEALTLSGSAGYFHSKYKTFIDLTGDRSGEDWPLTPKWTYSLSARFEQPTSVGLVSAQLDWSWRGRVNLDPSAQVAGAEIQKAFGLLNGRLALALPSLNGEIALFGRNLLDEKYNVSGLALESVGFDFVNRGAPRTYGVQLTMRLGGER